MFISVLLLLIVTFERKTEGAKDKSPEPKGINSRIFIPGSIYYEYHTKCNNQHRPLLPRRTQVKTIHMNQCNQPRHILYWYIRTCIPWLVSDRVIILTLPVYPDTIKIYAINTTRRTSNTMASPLLPPVNSHTDMWPQNQRLVTQTDENSHQRQVRPPPPISIVCTAHYFFCGEFSPFTRRKSLFAALRRSAQGVPSFGAANIFDAHHYINDMSCISASREEP